MGGNLLKKWNLPEKRLALAEFLRLKNFVTEALSDAGPLRHDVPTWVREKADFGDLDVVIGIVDHSERADLKRAIKRLSSFEPSSNGDIISFPVDGFQVDCICVPYHKFSFALDYFSNNDFGNLMGRFARQMGLRLGHEGLRFVLQESFFTGNKENTTTLGEFFFSYGWDEAVTLVSGKRMPRTFATFEEMFQAVADCPNFHPNIFRFENLDSENRTRNRKRKVYARFVEWIEEKEKAGKFDHLNSIPKMAAQSFVPVLAMNNHSFLEWIENHRRDWVKRKIIADKFNGNVVKEITGLEGFALGSFIASYKNTFKDTHTFEISILGSPKKVIATRIKEYYEETTL